MIWLTLVTFAVIGTAISMGLRDSAQRRRVAQHPQYSAPGGRAPGYDPSRHATFAGGMSTPVPERQGPAWDALYSGGGYDDPDRSPVDAGSDGRGEPDLAPESELWGWTEDERLEAIEAAQTRRCCWVTHYAGWDGPRKLCGDEVHPGYIFCGEHLFELHELRDVPDRFCLEALGLERYLGDDDDEPFDAAAFEATLTDPEELEDPQPAPQQQAAGGQTGGVQDAGDIPAPTWQQYGAYGKELETAEDEWSVRAGRCRYVVSAQLYGPDRRMCGEPATVQVEGVGASHMFCDEHFRTTFGADAETTAQDPRSSQPAAATPPLPAPATDSSTTGRTLHLGGFEVPYGDVPPQRDGGAS